MARVSSALAGALHFHGMNHHCQLTIGAFFVVNPAAVGSPGSTNIGYVVRGPHLHPNPN